MRKLIVADIVRKSQYCTVLLHFIVSTVLQTVLTVLTRYPSGGGAEFLTRQQQARNERQKVDTERLRSRALTSIL